MGAALKRLSKLWFPCVLLLALFAVQFYLSGRFSALPPRIEIRPENHCMPYGLSVTAGELANYRGEGLSFMKEEAGLAGAIPVNVVITDGNYRLYLDFALQQGSFFTRRASEIGLNSAVISDKLASALFGPEEAVGSLFSLSGIEYMVCGVYRVGGLYGFLSADGLETVYVPHRSGFDAAYAAESGVKLICLPPGDSISSAFLADITRDELRAISPNIDNYVVNDYTGAGVTVKQFTRIGGFALAVLLVAALARLAYWIAADMVRFFQGALQSSYMKDLLRENALHLTERAAMLAAIAVAAAVLVSAARFEIYVPGWLMPPESLFDFAFYKQLIAEGIAEGNRLYAYKPTGYEIYYAFMLRAGIMLCIATVVSAIALFVRFWKVASSLRAVKHEASP